MANNKNQHFVPQGYLKSFSTDAGRRTINLYNLNSTSFIHGVSIRDQCSKNYFYGKDEDFEKSIQQLEGAGIAEIGKTISVNGVPNLRGILLFSLFQYLRTELFLRSEIAQWVKITRAIFGDQPPDRRFQFAETPAEAARIAFSSLAKLSKVTEDLECRVLSAHKGSSFITSDNPAYTFNKFLSQKKMGQLPGYGFSSSGMCMVLPISPKLLFFAYDQNVYQNLPTDGYSCHISSKDVEWINVATTANAHRNLYYQSTDSQHSVANAVFKGMPLMVKERYTMSLLKETAVRTRPGEVTFEATDLEGFRAPGRSFIASARNDVRHSVWPSFLKYRVNPKYFNTKTGAGIKRPTLVEDTIED